MTDQAQELAKLLPSLAKETLQSLQSTRERERQDKVEENNVKLREQRRQEKTDDTPIFLQLHYSTSFDRSGYPELRQEFVDFLEEALDRSQQQQHIRTYDKRGYLQKAQQYVEADQPALYEYYRLRDIHGMSYHDIYDLTTTRQSVATRYVNQVRRAIEYHYKRLLREQTT